MGENTTVAAPALPDSPTGIMVHGQGMFGDPTAFNHYQKVAACLSESTMVPQQYRGEANLGNCMIALDIAVRLGMPPLMVMQHLYVVYGNPSWSGQMVTALINGSGFLKNPLSFEFKSEAGKDEWGCRAVGVMNSTGKLIEGPWVDITMAKAEGWYDRKDKDTGKFVSKWRTIPDLMMRYRAATYFGRTVCPHVLIGLKTREEVEDVGPDLNLPDGPTIDVNTTPSIGGKPKAAVAAPAPTPTNVVEMPKEVPIAGTAAATPAPVVASTTTAPAAATTTKRQRKATPAPAPEPAADVEKELAPAEPAAAQAAAAAPAAPVDKAALANELDAIMESNGVSVDDFLSWIHGSGRDTRHQVDVSDDKVITCIGDLPEDLIVELLKDAKGLSACIRMHGKKTS